MTGRPDPLTLGVVWAALRSIAVEIGTTIHRTAYSEQAREGQDFSVSLFDAQGRMTAQGPYSPGHMGAMHFAVRNALAAYPGDTLVPGDVILLNDPALGSGHLPDFFVTAPVFAGDALVGFTTNIVHHTDVGGSRPGSQGVTGISDYHQEGLFIPPVKIVEAGREVDPVLRLIAANSRTPEKVLGDLRAQRGALRVGELRLAELVDRYGREGYEQCVEALLDETEATARERIAEIPDGSYPFTDWLDDCGPGTDPLRICVTVTVAGDELTVDFDGTDPQTDSGLNSYLNYTRSYAYAAVKSLTDPLGPMNAGALRPVTVRAPEGSLLNPRRPAGGGPRAILCYRIFEVVVGALAQALPDRVVAAGSHFANPTFGGHDPARGRRFVAYDLVLSGTGARAGRDGCEGMSSAFNAANIPVEAQEAAQPVLVERFELMPDTGGAGRFRGGCGVRRDLRMLGEDVRFTNLAERQRFAPYGLFGGHAGALGRTVLNPGTPGERELPGKVSLDLAHGDVVSFQLSGGGGYGDPARRDPRAVLEDVRLGLVTREAAARVYGVEVPVEVPAEVPAEVPVQRPATARPPGAGPGRGRGGGRRRPRVLLAKPGLDGHDRGAKVVVRALRDAGMEVLYTGRHQSVAAIVAAAVQEDVDVVGLSILSGAHEDYCRRVAQGLREQGCEARLLVGGTIPAAAAPGLRALGYEVFGTGSDLADIVAAVQRAAR